MKCRVTDKTYQTLRQEENEKVSRFYAIVYASVLTDKYGFGKSKMHQIIKTVQMRAQEIIEGRISLDDLEAVLSEEYDIIFSNERKR